MNNKKIYLSVEQYSYQPNKCVYTPYLILVYLTAYTTLFGPERLSNFFQNSPCTLIGVFTVIRHTRVVIVIRILLYSDWFFKALILTPTRSYRGFQSVFFNSASGQNMAIGAEGALRSNMLELLWSKTLSAPSFSRYQKHLIGNPYCKRISYLDSRGKSE